MNSSWYTIRTFGQEARGRPMDRKLELISLSEGEVQDSVCHLLPEIANSDAEVVNSALRSLVALHGAQAYATLFRVLFHLNLTSQEAEIHWARMLGHHQMFQRRLGADVDFRVSSLDYLTRVSGLLMNPMVMENAQLEKLKNETITDELTRLFNRRYFNQVLLREYKSSKRHHSPFSLILLDVDHFKTLNDRFGHRMGDTILRQVGEVIRKAVREVDYPCRYGGEEFAVIAPRTEQKGGKVLAQRIRKGVENLRFPKVGGVQPKVTLSGGLVSWPEDASSLEGLIQNADAALYKAKGNGRNRIEVHGGERRQSRRVKGEFMTICSILPQVRQIAFTEDLSVGGFGLKASNPMAPGSTLEFELSLENEKPLHAFGQVRYLEENPKTGDFKYGVSIVRMCAPDRANYRGFLANLMPRKF